MNYASLAAFERFRAAARRFPGTRRLEFASTGKGWSVTPVYDETRDTDWIEQQKRLEQQLLDKQLQAIARTL